MFLVYNLFEIFIVSLVWRHFRQLVSSFVLFNVATVVEIANFNSEKVHEDYIFWPQDILQCFQEIPKITNV